MIKKSNGFTIVELLIVIVVIGILAAITIVSFNGIQQRARVAAVQSDLNGAAKTLEIANATSSVYPATLAAANLNASSGTVFNYHNNTSGNTYCLSATNNTTTYSIVTGSTTPQVGDCTTAGIVGWWKLNGNANDSSTGANNATITSAALTTGQSGQGNGAYAFDGATSTIFAPTAPIAMSDVTVSGWAFVQTGVTKGTIIHVGGTNGYSIGIGTGFTATDNKLMVLFPNKRWISTFVSIGAGWHLFTLALAFDGTPTVSLDGVAIGSYPGLAAITPTAQITIGRNTGDEGANQAERTFNNSIDDVRLFSRMLSATEVQALNSAGAQ